MKFFLSFLFCLSICRCNVKDKNLDSSYKVISVFFKENIKADSILIQKAKYNNFNEIIQLLNYNATGDLTDSFALIYENKKLIEVNEFEILKKNIIRVITTKYIYKDSFLLWEYSNYSDTFWFKKNELGLTKFNFKDNSYISEDLVSFNYPLSNILRMKLLSRYEDYEQGYFKKDSKVVLKKQGDTTLLNYFLRNVNYPISRSFYPINLNDHLDSVKYFYIGEQVREAEYYVNNGKIYNATPLRYFKVINQFNKENCLVRKKIIFDNSGKLVLDNYFLIFNYSLENNH